MSTIAKQIATTSGNKARPPGKSYCRWARPQTKADSGVFKQRKSLRASSADDNSEPDEATHKYMTDEERKMALVRRAVMGLPEEESDPKTEPEDYGHEMDGH